MSELEENPQSTVMSSCIASLSIYSSVQAELCLPFPFVLVFLPSWKGTYNIQPMFFTN
jgi:hypothetical protein